MEYEFEEPSESRSLADYLSAFKRRCKSIAISAFLVFVIGICATIFLPSKYQSQAVILIEEQDIPQDLVRSTITSYAVQRIEEIKQRIMTTSNIYAVVEEFKLYSEKEMDRMTRTEIAREFRKNVTIQPVSAEVVDPRSGRPTEAVIAFKLSFKGKSPEKVQKVANKLVTLYLNENLRDRTEQSSSTTEFLRAEATALDTQLKQLENSISIFKDEHKGSLPELQSFNMSVLDRSERELIDINMRLYNLKTRKIELESQLSQLSPNAPTILANGDAVLSDADRLKALETEYRRKSSIYSPNHPALARLEREIEVLKNELGAGTDLESQVEQLKLSQNKLNALENTYAEEHPSLETHRNAFAKLAEDIDITELERLDKPDNPAYILLHTQIQAIDSETEALVQKKQIIRRKITDYEELLLRAPEVEKNYQSLLREYSNSQLKYREIKGKLMHAELGLNLEQERKGERFTLIQPPEFPEAAISPNRKMLGFVTLVLSIGVGIGIAMLLEMLDPRIYGVNALEKQLDRTVLVAIPLMVDGDQSNKNRMILFIVLVTMLAFGIVFLAVFHNFIKPLDVTWYIALRKLGLD